MPAFRAAPQHLHKSAVNALAHGRKRWFILPPAHAVYSTVPAAEWVARTWADERAPQPPAAGAGAGGARKPASPPAQPTPWRQHVVECTQNGGDVLFVPPGWGHATLNLRTSVGIALEFSTAWETSAEY